MRAYKVESKLGFGRFPVFVSIPDVPCFPWLAWFKLDLSSTQFSRWVLWKFWSDTCFMKHSSMYQSNGRFRSLVTVDLHHTRLQTFKLMWLPFRWCSRIKGATLPLLASLPPLHSRSAQLLEGKTNVCHVVLVRKSTHEAPTSLSLRINRKNL